MYVILLHEDQCRSQVYEVVKIQAPPVLSSTICRFLSLCFPDPITTVPAQRPPLSADRLSINQSDRSSGRRRNLGQRAEGSRRGGSRGSDPEGVPEGAIKVVQLTDIYIEPDYAEVSDVLL